MTEQSEQDCKRLRINTAHVAGFFLLAVGMGWFLRSGMHKADETDAIIKETNSVEDSHQ